MIDNIVFLILIGTRHKYVTYIYADKTLIYIKQEKQKCWNKKKKRDWRLGSKLIYSYSNKGKITKTRTSISYMRNLETLIDTRRKGGKKPLLSYYDYNTKNRDTTKNTQNYKGETPR